MWPLARHDVDRAHHDDIAARAEYGAPCTLHEAVRDEPARRPDSGTPRVDCVGTLPARHISGRTADRTGHVDDHHGPDHGDNRGDNRQDHRRQEAVVRKPQADPVGQRLPGLPKLASARRSRRSTCAVPPTASSTLSIGHHMNFAPAIGAPPALPLNLATSLPYHQGIPTFTAVNPYGPSATLADEVGRAVAGQSQRTRRLPRSWILEERKPDGTRVCQELFQAAFDRAWMGDPKEVIRDIPCPPLPTTTATTTTRASTARATAAKTTFPTPGLGASRLCRKPFMIREGADPAAPRRELIVPVPCPPGVSAGQLLTEPVEATTATTATTSATTTSTATVESTSAKAKHQPCKHPALAALGQACLASQSKR
jgi:hypothetical protein